MIARCLDGMAATVWKGHISFGMVSIPVRLFSGARAKTVSFHLLHKTDNSRIHEVMYCDAEDKPVSRGDLVKGFERKKGQYIVVTPEEIKKVTPPTQTVMEILAFVKGDQIDPIFFETSYFVAPDANGQKPYALLLEALRQSRYDGLAKMTMHGREHVVILRPAERGIMLHTMYYADEIRGVGHCTRSPHIRAQPPAGSSAMVNATPLGETPKWAFRRPGYRLDRGWQSEFRSLHRGSANDGRVVTPRQIRIVRGIIGLSFICMLPALDRLVRTSCRLDGAGAKTR